MNILPRLVVRGLSSVTILLLYANGFFNVSLTLTMYSLSQMFNATVIVFSILSLNMLVEKYLSDYEEEDEY